jgi:hypothetical protein
MRVEIFEQSIVSSSRRGPQETHLAPGALDFPRTLPADHHGPKIDSSSHVHRNNCNPERNSGAVIPVSGRNITSSMTESFTRATRK